MQDCDYVTVYEQAWVY